MGKRTPPDASTRLNSLPNTQLVKLLELLSTGDLDQAVEKSGGLKKADLAALAPDGDTGRLLDALEKRAVFLLVRKARLAVLSALPTAVDSLRGLSLAPASEREALGNMSASDIPTVAEEMPQRAATMHAIQALSESIRALLPDAKVMEQKRHAALGLFTLAKELNVYDLAKSYKEEDEERELDALAREMGLDGYDGNEPEADPTRNVH